MTVFDDNQRVQPPEPGSADERILSEIKKATLRGDPTAIYQAILLCHELQTAPPKWLLDHLLEVISRYHLGVKPSWKGVGNRPIIVIRRRLEVGLRRRAVLAVRAWVKDRAKYQALPTACIRSWERQDYLHCEFKTDADALDFASLGLQGIRLQVDGPLLKCSARTLRRTMENKDDNNQLLFSGRIADVFGFTDLDSLFGYDKPLKPNLK